MTAREWKIQNQERALAARDYQAERHTRQLESERILEAIQTFHGFLQGVPPKGYKVKPFKKMNAKQAFTVIWFLQERCHLLPDEYEMCSNCETIYDSYSEGTYNDKTGNTYCGSCPDPDAKDDKDDE
jgi:hypothetical protein